jgi:hypothetical protein
MPSQKITIKGKHNFTPVSIKNDKCTSYYLFSYPTTPAPEKKNSPIKKEKKKKFKKIVR